MAYYSDDDNARVADLKGGVSDNPVIGYHYQPFYYDDQVMYNNQRVCINQILCMRAS
jgi:hypothetical protein